ncbi:MAG: response regulator [Candidatus Acidiferrales bacterium]|jgi:CheY-like chemotaxis protein
MLNKVLVVEDDPITCELIHEVLSSAEIEAHAVTDSAQAAARLRENKFDAVFLDVHMPPPDGIELARQMRASRLNQKTVIVMITGEEDRGVLARAFQVGANFFLFKPVDRQVLLRLMRVTQGPIDRERRRFTRVNINRRVSMEMGEDRLQGTTLDASVNGMLVQASRVFPVGSAVQISLELDPGKSALHATARVVRLIGNDRMGLELENVRPAESERLQEFLLPLILAKTD